MPEEKILELLFGYTPGFYRILTSPDQITHGLIFFSGNIDRREFSGTM
jgi:hypothetical protein